ncbi:outer membrane protein, cobalt-zinc-cadmium efflux system [Mucilaginibacter lappiensis]|uniref:Cobalt-zinc-cadmium efflux system outer membrane protein n=1 Tax=Mucilaginibacter lappiensis TaxID=354630 RepID=A0ABR6PD80_9SPHI|nr:TolC family protein [Mucilaginibacter lappiensis]MBB6107711.1 cobalt-zinc-cadmium efflux system outer membrane protein [Mucilaginibacter lappiensis]SIP99564.1 outer membrane protein, cobalt-zinc-cadmium efflux system [Mucilaginibacter lappiensis]
MKIKYFLVVICLMVSQIVCAQTDTLKISFQQAERTFLENNLGLIAERFHVAAVRALIDQAKLWDNPTLATDQNLYDNTHTFFNHAHGNGEIYAVLSQVFLTAGKRGKEIRMARDQASLEEAQFRVLMRNLHYNLQLDFAQLATLNEQAKVFRYEMTAGDSLVKAIENAYKTDKTKEKDVIRLKALLFSVENDQVDNSSQINNLEAELKSLLRTKSTVFILPLVKVIPTEETEFNIPELIRKAQQNRADFQAAQYTVDYAADNLAYQKSLAIPNVTVGVDYDRINSYAPNYLGLQIGLPLPVFNRNQGNIKSARYNLESQQNQVKDNELRLENGVIATVQQYQLSKALLVNKHLEFNEQYDRLFKTLLVNYKSGKTGLTDFVDFFDSYKDTKLKILQQQFNLQKAIADVNYTVGTTVVK